MKVLLFVALIFSVEISHYGESTIDICGVGIKQIEKFLLSFGD